MSRVLVTYADALGDVVAAALSEHPLPDKAESEAERAAWRELVSEVGAHSALADFTRHVVHLAPGQGVRWLVVRRPRGAALPHGICTYARLVAARAAIRALAGVSDYAYSVQLRVQA